MKTFLGKDAPLPDNDNAPHVVDVVMHLGRTKRFGGWGHPEWTVLHHSMLVSLLWASYYDLDGMHLALLHDAHEAYTGDIPSPVKQFMGHEQVKMLERDLDKRIRSMVSVFKEPDEYDQKRVKLVDQAALIIEAYHFGTPGSFDLIGSVNWGVNVGVTAEDRETIRNIITVSCPEVVEAMNAMRLRPGTAGQFEAVYK
jgi:hypothetical protein